MPPLRFNILNVPEIPIPPTHSIFASLSAFTLFTLISTNCLPGHPHIIIIWSLASYCMYRLWVMLRTRQRKALEEERDRLLALVEEQEAKQEMLLAERERLLAYHERLLAQSAARRRRRAAREAEAEAEVRAGGRRAQRG